MPEVSKKEKITTIGKIDLRCGDIALFNFTLKLIKSNGLNFFEIKNRECKISFEGDISKDGNKIISTSRYLAYSITENLPIKRGIEVYSFFLNIFSGKELKFNIKELSASVYLQNKIERFKVQKTLESINKYIYICNKEKIPSNEKIPKLLRNAYEIDLVYHTLIGKPIQSSVDICVEGDFVEGDSIQLVRNFKTHLKGLNFNITESIYLEDTISESEIKEGKISVFGKNSRVVFRKNT